MAAKGKKGTTDKKWDMPDKSDARKAQGAGSYPDYFSWKSRSGHTFQLDDSKGAETVTLQHRSGTAIQMTQDGALHITAHNGKYEITFGENRMTISGAQDITVKGDASMRVYGDYNVTCHKDYNLTVLGNMNLAAKNLNRHILGNIDTQSRNENKKLLGSSAKNVKGAIAYVAKGSTTFASQSDQVHLGGATGVNLAVKKGNITQNIEEEGNFHIATEKGEYNALIQGAVKMKSKEETMDMVAEKEFKMTSKTDKMKLKAKDKMSMESESESVEVKASQDVSVNAQNNVKVNGNQEAWVNAGQTAGIQGGSDTKVSAGSKLHLKGGSGVAMDGPTIQKNNGESQAFPGFSLPSFSFGDFADAKGEKGQAKGIQAPDKPAGNDEANQWA
jgi:hypothetical protein